MHLCRSSSNVPRLPPAIHRFWKCYKTLTFCSLLTRCTIPCACNAKAHLNVQKCSIPVSFFHFWLRNVRRATTACTFSTSQLPKVVWEWCVLYILTWKCASRHNGVHFFDIWTSKSGPNLVFCTFWLGNVLRATAACTFSTSQLPKVVRSWCFAHFVFEMCFAPQRRALFRHLNFQKWSDPGVLCTFWLGNVLRATTACTFLSLIWPAGSAPAALASLLFDPPEPQIIGKTQCFCDFPTFSRAWIFFLPRLSLLWSALFYSSLLSASSHLFFSSVHIVGSLTPKLPSII